MIDPKECRLGNWMEFELLDYSPEQKQVTSVEEEYIYYMDGRDQLYSHREAINPIPLTEQWLKEFGFDYEGNGHIWSKDIGGSYSLCLCKVSKYWDCWLWDDPDGWEFALNHPKYVHQLQNLYFALTGAELERKELKKWNK